MTKIESDDWEDEDEVEAEFDDVHKFGSDEESHASLMQEDANKAEFMASTSPSDQEVDLGSTMSSLMSASSSDGGSYLSIPVRLEKVKFAQ